MSSYRRRRRVSRARASAAPPGFLNQRNVTVAFFAVAILALVVFALRSGARPGLPAVGRADPGNAAQVAAGQSLYAT